MNHLTYPIGEAAIIIDIRDEKSYRSGHLPGSISFTVRNMKRFEYLIPDAESYVIVTDEARLDELRNIQEHFTHLLICGFLLDTDLPKEACVQSETISAKDFLALEGDDYLLLDVRHPSEITRIAPDKQLLSIPLQSFNLQQPALLSDRKIYTLCGSGNRATLIASLLKLSGFNTTIIEGGMKAIEAIRAE